ncbi:hypothetical protein RIF29_14738 [Crotalaria pallida]|uniref:Uncharacterized protein n=1 Tax=Crotalaria pallida TaxID=3830 RepID=A0AAN9FDX8_CROPI
MGKEEKEIAAVSTLIPFGDSPLHNSGERKREGTSSAAVPAEDISTAAVPAMGLLGEEVSIRVAVGDEAFQQNKKMKGYGFKKQRKKKSLLPPFYKKRKSKKCVLEKGDPVEDAKSLWEMGKELGVLSVVDDETVIRKLTLLELKELGIEDREVGFSVGLK